MYTYNVKLDRVVDGDTIDVMVDLGFNVFTHQRLRLARIDAPERFTEDGKESTQSLKNLLQYGDMSVKTTKIGKYGRYIAEVTLDRDGEVVNVSDALVRAGKAVYKNY